MTHFYIGLFHNSKERKKTLLLEIDQEIFNMMLAKSMHQIARIEFRNSKFPYARGLFPLATPARGPAPWKPPSLINNLAPPLSSGWIRPWLWPFWQLHIETLNLEPRQGPDSSCQSEASLAIASLDQNGTTHWHMPLWPQLAIVIGLPHWPIVASGLFMVIYYFFTFYTKMR